MDRRIVLTLVLLCVALPSTVAWSETPEECIQNLQQDIFRQLMATGMDDLVERGGLYYKKFTDVPFTGEIAER